MFDLPVIVWLLVLTGVVGLIAMTGVALSRGAVSAGAGREPATRRAAGVATIMAVWLLLNGFLASRQVFLQGPGSAVPWIGVAVGGGIVGLLLATRAPALRTALAGPETAVRLLMPQVFRVVGAVFLIVMLLGELPPVFALPAGLGDLAVGVAAVLLLRQGRTGRLSPASLRWFNLLGLADLVVAVSIGFLAAPGAYQLITGEPSTEAVALLPLALVPTVAVPLAAALHVISLRRLSASRPAVVRGNGATPASRVGG